MSKAAADNGGVKAMSLPKGSISARIYRAATDSWEDLGVISKPKEEGKSWWGRLVRRQRN